MNFGRSGTSSLDCNITGQVVLITGGTRGLGLALARRFAGEGCKLVLCARDAQELADTRQEFERQGTPVLTIECDVADRRQVERLIEQATAHFGRIDILVNNAGVIQVGPVQQLTVEDFETALAIDFWSQVYTTLAVLPQMRQRRSGRIVNITSIGGKVSIPRLLPYSAAKFATVGFSEGLAAELAAEGISVTTIVPGLLRTGSFQSAYFEANQTQEATWFTAGAVTPLTAMLAERAAEQIVEAAKDRQIERILSWQAVTLAKFHALLPSLSVRLADLVNRFILPRDLDQPGSPQAGMVVRASPLLKALKSLGQPAARRLHQYPGTSASLDESRQANRNS